MLKKDFLRTLSDYVSEITVKSLAIEKEAKTFGLFEYVVENEQEREKLQGLFSEWLVFDRKQIIFDGFTGLEYFIKHNPLKFTPENIKLYEDLLDFEIGYFEVKEVETGRGVLLKSIATGMEHFVHDINASLSVKKEDTLWTRIASVGGLFHMVGHLFLIVPLKIMPNLQNAISGWDKNSLNAKEMAKWLQTSSNKFELNKNEEEIP